MRKLNTIFIVTLFALITFSANVCYAYLTEADILSLPSSTPTTTFNYGNAPQEFADLRMPNGQGPFPVVILIHGGCWVSTFANLSIMAPLASAITEQLGVATLNIEYRAIDQTGGGWPGTFNDVSTAINYLSSIASTYNLDLTNVIVLGHSAGGHLALWSGASSNIDPSSPIYIPLNYPIKGIVDLAGPGSLESFYPYQDIMCKQPVLTEFLGGSPEEQPVKYHQASPIDLLPFKIQQVLIAGADDPNFPSAFGIQYQAAGRQAGDNVNYIEVDNASHFEPLSPYSDVWPYLKSTLSNMIFSTTKKSLK